MIKKKGRLPMINKPKLPRKRNKPNYANIQKIDGENHGQAYQPVAAKEKYRHIYYEVIDLIVESIKEPFEKESNTISAALEKLLLTVIDEENLDKSTLKLLEDNYADEFHISILTTEMVVGNKSTNNENNEKR